MRDADRLQQLEERVARLEKKLPEVYAKATATEAASVAARLDRLIVLVESGLSINLDDAKEKR